MAPHDRGPNSGSIEVLREREQDFIPAHGSPSMTRACGGTARCEPPTTPAPRVDASAAARPRAAILPCRGARLIGVRARSAAAENESTSLTRPQGDARLQAQRRGRAPEIAQQILRPRGHGSGRRYLNLLRSISSASRRPLEATRTCPPCDEHAGDGARRPRSSPPAAAQSRELDSELQPRSGKRAARPSLQLASPGRGHRGRMDHSEDSYVLAPSSSASTFNGGATAASAGPQGTNWPQRAPRNSRSARGPGGDHDLKSPKPRSRPPRRGGRRLTSKKRDLARRSSHDIDAQRALDAGTAQRQCHALPARGAGTGRIRDRRRAASSDGNFDRSHLGASRGCGTVPAPAWRRP
jgi:hypothetical protein